VSTSAERPDVLVDTSAAVAFVLSDHDHHKSTYASLRSRRLGLAGHAAFETYSVLTRLPPPVRRAPGEVDRLLRHNFPASRFLDAAAATALLHRLGPAGITGDGVYDALVGAAAVAHELPLATRDARALAVYRRLDVELEILA
jgi:predicted nucleic acid-binding protein